MLGSDIRGPIGIVGGVIDLLLAQRDCASAAGQVVVERSIRMGDRLPQNWEALATSGLWGACCRLLPIGRFFDRELSVAKYTGPPLTLGNTAAAHVRLIIWC